MKNIKYMIDIRDMLQEKLLILFYLYM